MIGVLTLFLQLICVGPSRPSTHPPHTLTHTQQTDIIPRSENDGAAAEDAADSTAAASGTVRGAAAAVMDGAIEEAKDVVLGAKDRVSLGGVEVSPLGVGAWAWGDTMFWGYSEAMDKELQEVRMISWR